MDLFHQIKNKLEAKMKTFKKIVAFTLAAVMVAVKSDSIFAAVLLLINSVTSK